MRKKFFAVSLLAMALPLCSCGERARTFSEHFADYAAARCARWKTERASAKADPDERHPGTSSYAVYRMDFEGPRYFTLDKKTFYNVFLSVDSAIFEDGRKVEVFGLADSQGNEAVRERLGDRWGCSLSSSDMELRIDRLSLPDGLSALPSLLLDLTFVYPEDSIPLSEGKAYEMVYSAMAEEKKEAEMTFFDRLLRWVFRLRDQFRNRMEVAK